MNLKFKIGVILSALFVFAAIFSLTAYAAPPTNACSLLTPAQVSAVLGVPAAGNAFGPNVCIWLQTGVEPGSPRRKVVFTMLLMQGYTGGYALAKTPNAPTIAAFAFRVQRSGTPFTPDQIKTKEKTLAQEALAKL